VTSLADTLAGNVPEADDHGRKSHTRPNGFSRRMPHLAVALRGAASHLFRVDLGYGVTWLTDVPQFARPFLVPPQMPNALGWKAGGAQFGDWMYSLAK